VAETAGQTQDDQGAPKTLEEKACFIIGYNFIRSMQSQKVEFLLDSVIAGMRTAADNKEIGMTDEEVVAVMDSFEQKMMERYQAKLKAEAEENQVAGEKYLETNRTKEGVQALPSGVQFRVLKAGTGTDSPKGEDSVEVHYAGRTIDGTEFDSSIKRGEPATFPVLQVIKGFSEALQNMKVGDKWEVTIPAHLAYGMKGQGPIGPNQVLIFEVELLQIKKQ
jgi:FKBP-type peptidyl-prolyl cis-trans isomerase